MGRVLVPERGTNERTVLNEAHDVVRLETDRARRDSIELGTRRDIQYNG